MSQNLIKFKGKREGISIYIKKGSFEDIQEELETKIKKSEQFFQGAKVIEIAGIDGKYLTQQEREAIETLVTEKYSMIMDENKRILKENIVQAEEEQNIDLGYFDGLKEGSTKFINTTIRSGQLIEYDGNIVVIGDVNPGGEISVKGNIVVLGTLRGTATAGNDGNKDAIVAAFKLCPTQLRIANLITRRPDKDEDTHTPKEPEIARIYDDAIIIESYLIKK